MRYVERNALRANLCTEAQSWQPGSLWRRCFGSPEQKALLAAWPVGMPKDWRRLVNQPMHETEVEAIRHSIQRGKPYGDAAWVAQASHSLGLEFTLRPRGRPRAVSDPIIKSSA